MSAVACPKHKYSEVDAAPASGRALGRQSACRGRAGRRTKGIVRSVRTVPPGPALPAREAGFFAGSGGFPGRARRRVPVVVMPLLGGAASSVCTRPMKETPCSSGSSLPKRSTASWRFRTPSLMSQRSRTSTAWTCCGFATPTSCANSVRVRRARQMPLARTCSRPACVGHGGELERQPGCPARSRYLTFPRTTSRTPTFAARASERPAPGFWDLTTSGPSLWPLGARAVATFPSRQCACANSLRAVVPLNFGTLHAGGLVLVPPGPPLPLPLPVVPPLPVVRPHTVAVPAQNWPAPLLGAWTASPEYAAASPCVPGAEDAAATVHDAPPPGRGVNVHRDRAASDR
jgi:hypothetical protein